MESVRCDMLTFQSLVILCVYICTFRMKTFIIPRSHYINKNYYLLMFPNKTVAIDCFNVEYNDNKMKFNDTVIFPFI